MGYYEGGQAAADLNVFPRRPAGCAGPSMPSPAEALGAEMVTKHPTGRPVAGGWSLSLAASMESVYSPVDVHHKH